MPSKEEIERFLTNQPSQEESEKNQNGGETELNLYMEQSANAKDLTNEQQKVNLSHENGQINAENEADAQNLRIKKQAEEDKKKRRIRAIPPGLKIFQQSYLNYFKRFHVQFT